MDQTATPPPFESFTTDKFNAFNPTGSKESPDAILVPFIVFIQVIVTNHINDLDEDQLKNLLDSNPNFIILYQHIRALIKSEEFETCYILSTLFCGCVRLLINCLNDSNNINECIQLLQTKIKDTNDTFTCTHFKTDIE